MGHSAGVTDRSPETESTDFDEPYFEALGHETVMDLVKLEVHQGAIASIGGQTSVVDLGLWLVPGG